eukprot:TRINITY_DN37251_c0_g1_i1.p1 TRINITY_DN37251_c0_g1~~TRINITY_DN37251_c0_g1_i1.p1  ORF type:complete len:520 (-),score=94.27 TRINITY_DN37251_c0_g1_i1:78-1556(-)
MAGPLESSSDEDGEASFDIRVASGDQDSVMWDEGTQSTPVAAFVAPSDVSLPGAIVACGEEEPVCRICFVGREPGEANSLIAPCVCSGSQKYVHVHCLRQWQRAVQLSRPCAPETDGRRSEERHMVCGVCRGRFSVPPPDRAVMMSDLANMDVDDISAGVLLVTKHSFAEEEAALGPRANIALYAYLKAKVAHFREAVYILTDVDEADGSDSGEDVVFGMNLTRTLDISNVSMLEGAADEASIRRSSRKGVEVQWMNGGPVRPRSVSALLCVERLSPGRVAELCARHGLRPLQLGDDSEDVVHGPMPGVLAVAEEEAEAVAAFEGGACKATTVFAWAGVARWSRLQLLGEIARGRWGWCQASQADVKSAIVAHELLWASLRHSSRLHWAPENSLSRQDEDDSEPTRRRGGLFQFRLTSSRRRAADEARADAFVRRLELLRRGSATTPSAATPAPALEASGRRHSSSMGTLPIRRTFFSRNRGGGDSRTCRQQ